GTLLLNAANTFTGSLTVNGGTVTDAAANALGAGAVVINNGGQVTVNNAGTATTTTSFTVNAGGTPLVDGTTHTANPLSGTTTLTLGGAPFPLPATTAAATNTAETLGAVNVQAGFSTVNLNKGTGGNLTLSGASLAQTTTGAAVNFVAGGG